MCPYCLIALSFDLLFFYFSLSLFLSMQAILGNLLSVFNYFLNLR